MFHDPKERCPHNPCLLGHQEAREAFRASKAFARCKRLTESKEDNITETAKATAPGVDTGGNSTTIQDPHTDPKPTYPENNPNPNPSASQPPTHQLATIHDGGKSVNPVNFEALAQENTGTEQQDEIKRLCKITENMKSDIDALKKVTEERTAGCGRCRRPWARCRLRTRH